jgi:hypothetical protein
VAIHYVSFDRADEERARWQGENRTEEGRGGGCYLEGLHKGHFPLLMAEQLLVVTHTHAHEPLS